MQVRQLLKDDDAVSPVIGVILMVAITVILAAVIASFVLGLGGSQQQTPTASFSWDYEDTGTADKQGTVTVSHDGGDSIKYNELYFRGSGFDNSIDGSSYSLPSPHVGSAGSKWPEAAASGKIGDTSAVVGGDQVPVGVKSNFEISLVWQPQSGDTSATLSEKKGPDA